MKHQNFFKPRRWAPCAALLCLMSLAMTRAAESLPAWVGAEFASISFSRTNCQMTFKDQGARFSVALQRAGEPEDSLLTDYGTTLNVDFGTQARLRTRGIVIEIGSLPSLKPEEVSTVAKDLCDFVGSNRKMLCLDVPAFAFFKRVDQRSAGKNLIEHRAIVVPIRGLPEAEVSRLETLLATKFGSAATKSADYLWVACERSQD